MMTDAQVTPEERQAILGIDTRWEFSEDGPCDHCGRHVPVSMLIATDEVGDEEVIVSLCKGCQDK